MKKGFIFSTDAAIGIAVVFLAIGTASLFYFNTGSEAKIFQTIEQNASDAAAIGFYLNKTPADMGMGTAISDDAKQGYCATNYTYNPDNQLGTQAVPAEKKYCGKT